MRPGPNTGMGRVMHCTADELRRLGHEVDLLFSPDVPRRWHGPLDRFAFPLGVVRTIRRWMHERGRYDVVEIHEPSAAWYCYLRRRGADLPPCVVMSHGVEENAWRHRLALDRLLGERTRIKSRILVPTTRLSQSRYSLRHCQQVMCLNSSDEIFLKKENGLAPAQVSRVIHGVEDRFFVERDADHEHSTRVLFIGAWLDNKGRRIIPNVFSRLLRTHPKVRLTVLGSGYCEDHVLADFEEGERARVTVRSSVDDQHLIRAYREHHVLLSGSYYESFGLAPLEAAAAKMAIVSTQAPGPANIFTDGYDALLVPRADPAAMAAAVVRLLDNPNLRRWLGNNARQLARLYTWRAAAESHLAAYARALALDNSRGPAATAVQCQ